MVCVPSVVVDGYQTWMGMVRAGWPPGGVYVVISSRCPQVYGPME